MTTRRQGKMKTLIEHIKAQDRIFLDTNTPRHTRGGICLYANGNVFTGDTLFVGSVGRTDFPGSSMKKIERSGHTPHRYNLKFVALTISKKKKRMNKILSSAS